MFPRVLTKHIGAAGRVGINRDLANERFIPCSADRNEGRQAELPESGPIIPDIYSQQGYLNRRSARYCRHAYSRGPAPPSPPSFLLPPLPLPSTTTPIDSPASVMLSSPPTPPDPLNDSSPEKRLLPKTR